MKTRYKLLILWGVWLLLNLIPLNMFVFTSETVPIQETHIAIFWLMLSAAVNQGIYILLFLIDILAPIILTTIILRPKKK